MTVSTGIASRLTEIRTRIRRAAQAGGRDPATIRLIGVTKGVDLSAIEAAAADGLVEFGESRVQEALTKMSQRPHGSGLSWVWHLIGRLQTNKVRAAAGRFGLIHSVDSLRLGEAIATAAADAGIQQRVLVQVNVAHEPQKGGVAPSDLPALLAALARCSHLRIDGLMTIPPVAADPEQARPYFRELRRLGEKVMASRAGGAAVEYSMGMSGDFEVAIEEGATMVRIGTAIFGARVTAGVAHTDTRQSDRTGEPRCS